ncbi:DUF1990 domain-containing protein [Kribbella sp. NPDC051936]|uniref:DUF1990 family protein n=1 Tax=Kribbella sp. NPDC051936 TaxID=3154946 RepID=UPI00342BFD02
MRPALPELAATYEGIRPGYERTVRLGHGSPLWTFASTEVLRWGVKTRSGFSVESAVVDRVAPGDRYWLVAHLGPFRVREPVEILEVVDEPELKGFTYGTLRGHPVRGTETFLVERRPDGSVQLTIRSRTQAAPGAWRVAYPVALLAQRFYRKRYFRALSR